MIILYPHLNYQPYLAQGDHGRDLYSYKLTYEGGVPYRDYFSQNGPLMPYFYSLFYRLFDVSISSTLLGYYFCVLLAGVLIYLICSLYLDPVISLCASLWYWAFRGAEFFYTYNHIGGVVMMLTAVYCLVRFIRDSNDKFIYWGLAAITLLFLTRATIALSTLTAFSLILIIRLISAADGQSKSRMVKFILCAAVSLTFVFSVYWLLTHDLPRYVGGRDIAYWKFLRFDKIPRALSALSHITYVYFYSTVINALFTLLGMGALGFIFYKYTSKSGAKRYRSELLAVMGLLFILSVFNLGELLVTGIWFYALWNVSLITVLAHFVFNIGYGHLARPLRTLLVCILLLTPVMAIIKTTGFLISVKRPANEFWVGKNRIYMHPSQREHMVTMTRAAIYLHIHLEKDEKFLAIPYDPVYYYLSNRHSATRQLIIFNIDEYRERDLIEDIRENRVKHILVSNRAYRPLDKKFGVMGKDYGAQLQRYIDDQFEPAATFGRWDSEAGWTANHAVKIYRKN